MKLLQEIMNVHCSGRLLLVEIMEVRVTGMAEMGLVAIPSPADCTCLQLLTFLYHADILEDWTLNWKYDKKKDKT